MKKILTYLALAVFALGGGSALTASNNQVVHAEESITHSRSEQDDPITTFDEPSIVFHYWRFDGNYNGFELWLWDGIVDGTPHGFTHFEEDFGKYLVVTREEFSDPIQINFIIRSAGSWDSQTPDASIFYSDFTFDVATNAYHFYLVNTSTVAYPSAEAALANQVNEAVFSTRNTIKVTTNNEPATYRITKGDSEIIAGPTTGKKVNNQTGAWSFTINLGTSFVPVFTDNYVISVNFVTDDSAVRDIGLEGLYDDEYFISNLTYDGNDLGANYSQSETVFKAWAPTVRALELRIYNSGTPVSLNVELGDDTHAKHNFVRGEKGVWSVTVSGDLHGKYYTFYATHANSSIELTDPYAKSAGINGVRGMIVDFSKTNPLGWDNVDYSVKKPTEIVPYELHVADLTADETWNGSEENRKKFLGLIEEGTTYTKDGVTVSTGFDHITELGINALQIIPFYDQNNDERNMSFNWGYNPHNYNVLEGGYSSNPYDGLVRIREFKEVVQAYAEYDIRIIMDVVYNHVASLSAHSFSKLVPGYYFRYMSDGSPDNSSGVGNVTASERIMMELFMRDSTAFWVEEYKIGGFRFDLMGLHTQSSMNTLMNNLQTIREDIIVFGEGWQMDQTGIASTLATQENLNKIPGIGAFNDAIRDAFVGNQGSPMIGWSQMSANEANVAVINKNRIRSGLTGKIHGHPSTPDQTINYAAAHDNYTLYDKLTLAGKVYFTPEQIAQQSLLTDSVILLSQGVSFIHAGSEILRSKPLEDEPGRFDHNSYQSSYAVNSLKWDEKVTNLKIFEEYQKLLKIKTTVPGFQYMTSAEISANVTVEFGREFDLDDTLLRLRVTSGNDQYTIYFYTVGNRLRFDDLVGQQVVVDTSRSLEVGSVIEGRVTLEAGTTLVVKNYTGTPDPDPGSETTPPDDNGDNGPLLYLIISGATLSLGGATFAVLFFLRKKKPI